MIIGDFPWPPPDPWERPYKYPYGPCRPQQPFMPEPFVFPSTPCPGRHVDPAFAESPEFLEAKEKFDKRITEELKAAADREEAEKKRKAEEKAEKEKEKRRQLFEELKKEFEDE